LNGGGDLPPRGRRGDEHTTNSKLTSKVVPLESARAALHQAFALASTTGAVNSHTALSALPSRPKLPVKEVSSEAQKKSSQAPVRNPHYSPNKPYHDVENHNGIPVDHKWINEMPEQRPFNTRQPLVGIPNSRPYAVPLTYLSEATPAPPIPKVEMPAKPLARKDPSCHTPVDGGLPLQSLTASSLLNTKMGTFRKMPVTNTLTGTLYYKKSFSDATVKQASIHHQKAAAGQRSRADGAPAKQESAVAEMIQIEMATIKGKPPIVPPLVPPSPSTSSDSPEQEDMVDGKSDIEEDEEESTPSG
jgi:hypothetical protein